MSKKMSKITTALLSAATAICLLFGIVFVHKQGGAVVSSAEMVTSTKWVAPYHQLTGTEDSETGYTHLTISNHGERMYYNEKVTLDGLTVILGSSNLVASSRFGFGFVNAESNESKGKYTLSEITTVNVTCVPYQYEGQNRLYVNSNHADGTICYRDSALTNNSFVFGLDQSFVATGTGNDAYSFAFELVEDKSGTDSDVWSVTVDVVKGTKFATQTTPCTVYFSGSKMPGVLDANGQCCISAWGMSAAGSFYIGVITAEEKALIAAADSALSAYQTKKTSSATASVAAEREAAISAIKALPTKYQSDYEAKLLAIDQIDSTWVPAHNTCGAATYNKSFMASQVTPVSDGSRIYYHKKVKLDGLTVRLGMQEQATAGRYGFGLIGGDDPKMHSALELKTLNIYGFYGLVAGRTDLFIYHSNMATETTVAYLDEGLTTAGVCRVDGGNPNNSYVSSTPSPMLNAYDITFHKVNEKVWSITISLLTGNTFGDIPATTTAYISSDVLANAIDAEGNCYVSAFGFAGTAPFYINVKEASLQESLVNADAALEAYREAVTSGQGSTEAKEAYLSVISSLPANEYAVYADKVVEVEALENALANITHSVSVTVSETLSLNYKIDFPQGVEITSALLTSEMCGKTEEYSGGFVDEKGRFVVPTQIVTPQYLTEQVTLKFAAYGPSGNTVVSREIIYSVKQYCETLLAESSDKALRTALIDLLNYGAEAQNYAKVNTGSLANADVSEYQVLATPFNASGVTDVSAVNQGSVVAFKAATLQLEDKVAVYAKFTTTASVSALTATAKIGSGSETALEIQDGGNGVYYVVLPGVSPLQYADNIIFSVYYNGSVNAQCRYSVNSYIARKYGDAKCGALVKALYSYGVGVSGYAASVNGTAPLNLIQDTFYENGSSVIAPDGSATTTASTINQGATPIWQVCQWDSVGNLSSTPPTISNGVYTYTDAAKTLSLNTNTGATYMAIKGSVEYADGDRSQVSTPWPHLLLQQDYYGDQLINLSQMSSLKMQMTYKVTHCDNRMQGQVDADNLHCAQVVWYISLQNRTEGHAEYGEYMWFGMILYDNREEGSNFTLTYKVDDDSTANTGKMICQPASADWSSTGRMAKVGETINVDFDILSVAKAAFNKAQRTYGLFSKSSWEDMYIGTMNFGIELPGTYNIGVEFDNVGLMYTK